MPYNATKAAKTAPTAARREPADVETPLDPLVVGTTALGVWVATGVLLPLPEVPVTMTVDDTTLTPPPWDGESAPPEETALVAALEAAEESEPEVLDGDDSSVLEAALDPDADADADADAE